MLHEHEIRKPRGEFSFLQIEASRQEFQADLSAIMEDTDYKSIYSIIKKAEFIAKYPAPENPYDFSMSFVLERAFLELNSIGQQAKLTSVIVECRGPMEDRQLCAAFDKIAAGKNACGRSLPFQIKMVPKSANSPGLQLADLTARPIGIRSLRPDQPNRAFEIIKKKIRRNAQGVAENWGVKVFP